MSEPVKKNILNPQTGASIDLLRNHFTHSLERCGKVPPIVDKCCVLLQSVERDTERKLEGGRGDWGGE